MRRWVRSAFVLVVAATLAPIGASAQTPAPSKATAKANQRAFVVDRPQSSWTTVVVGVPRAGVPRTPLVVLAAWLSSPKAKTDGTLALVRGRGGHINATATEDGLLFRVEGASADSQLLLAAALSVLDAVSVSAQDIDGLRRALRNRQPSTSLEPMRAAAWQTFYSRPAPGTTPAPHALRELSAQEVSAASAQIARKDAVVVVEGPRKSFGVDDTTATGAVDSALQQKRAAIGAQPVAVKRRSINTRGPLPRPHAESGANATAAGILLAQPLAIDIARHPLAATFLAQQLRDALFGTKADIQRRQTSASAHPEGDVWIETNGTTALLFVRPPPEQSVDAVKKAVGDWRKTSRFTRVHFDAAARVADGEASVAFTSGDVAQLLAARAMGPRHQAHVLDASDRNPAKVRAWLEEFPLHVFPAHLRVFRAKATPGTL